MSLHHIYSNASNSTQDITAHVRLYQWSATTDAKEGSVAHSTMVVDDPDGILDFVGHRRLYSYEDLAAPSNQVVYNGFIQNQKVSRGPYRNGAGRIWTLDLADTNVLLHRRLMNGEDANRPAEDDVPRMEALVGLGGNTPMTELNTIDDTLYFSGVSPVAMDAVDYRTQPVGTGYIDDCAQASGKNYFAWYREATGQYSFWYDFAESSNFQASIALSNVFSDVDEPNVFAVDLEQQAVLDRDPSRVASGIMLPFDGVAVGSNTISGTVYVQDQDTTDTFAAIDWLAPSLNVKTKAKALARANRYLADAAEQDNLIHASVKLPAANVNDILAGQSVLARFEHFPGYGDNFHRFRCLSRTVTEISEDPTRAYRLDLELSPIVVPGVPSFFTAVNQGGCQIGTWPLGTPPDGALLVGYLCQRDVSTYDATIVPVGVDEPAGSTTCSSDDIAGTEWTFIDNLDVNNGAGQGALLTFAYRDAEANEPQVIQWGGGSGTGLSGTARPRSHQIAIEGLSGAPTVTAKGVGTNNGTSDYTSPAITVTGPGYIFAGFAYRASFFTGSMSGRAPSVSLTDGLAYGGYPFDPYSWFGYIHVTPAMFAVTDTYNVVVDRSNTVNTVYAKGWVMGFWPE
jgi:hypothetical protein